MRHNYNHYNQNQNLPSPANIEYEKIEKRLERGAFDGVKENPLFEGVEQFAGRQLGLEPEVNLAYIRSLQLQAKEAKDLRAQIKLQQMFNKLAKDVGKVPPHPEKIMEAMVTWTDHEVAVFGEALIKARKAYWETSPDAPDEPRPTLEEVMGEEGLEFELFGYKLDSDGKLLRMDGTPVTSIMDFEERGGLAYYREQLKKQQAAREKQKELDQQAEALKAELKPNGKGDGKGTETKSFTPRPMSDYLSTPEGDFIGHVVRGLLNGHGQYAKTRPPSKKRH